uniref:NADH dehydrogenase subunit 6 n=1 Tax=Glomeridesmus spelaeus TaxID=2071608 RepID=A0A2I7MLA2_9MYRI|nr:NADH dehydrogenase subunit 6 [Glomeridesmus spelaeus]QCF39674.1 NADH dehydrogenase subunit 6 [Glomeridesmus spelaeus]QCF39687.1 NADH dehydrogenase subunit 6 [Glomeridesmus spelaeus]
MMIMIIMISISMIFFQLTHPMEMSILLIILTLTISINSLLFSMTPWFSYILFLIYMGGVMVMFMYMSSLTPNKLPITIKKIAPIMIFSLLFITFYNYKIFKSMNLKSSMSIMKSFTFLSMNMTMIIITILMITMISIIMITQNKKTPLRPISLK